MRAAVVRSHQYGRAVAVAYFFAGALAATMVVGAPYVPFSGSLFGLGLVVALAIAPVAIALAVDRPLIFPFAVWAALVPFDNLLVVSGIGKIAKPLGAAAAVAAVIAMLVRRRALIPPRAAGAWMLLVVFGTASLWWARDAGLGIIILQQVAGLLVVGAILSMVVADETDLKALFCGVVGGGVAAGTWAIWFYVATGKAAQVDPSIDHNHFGAALLLPALCATVAAISLRRPLHIALCALAAGLCVAGIGISESRGALIAFVVGVAYLIVRSRHRRRLMTSVAAGTAMLAFIPGVFGRFTDPTTGDASGRYQIWNIGLAAFKHNWFAGHGLGMFKAAYQASFLEYSQPASSAQRVQDPHNILVEFAVELGVIGLALLFLAWWWQFRTLREIGPSNGGWTDVRLAIEATTIALFVSALSLDLLTFKYAWLSLSAAWIVRAAYRSRASRSPEPWGDDADGRMDARAPSRSSLRNRRRGSAGTVTNPHPTYLGARIP